MTANMRLAIACGTIAITATLLGLAGCNKGGDQAKPPVAQIEAKKDNLGKTIEAQPVARIKDPRVLPFKEAVILDPPPEDEQRPPDATYNGKNAAKLFETIADDLWDKVAFTDDAGRRIKYLAIMTTELGDIHIDLLGDVAPNHVRSFVCLAKAGYFDDMAFYYSIRRNVDDALVAYIESGCPRGTGEYGSGSVGYWLRPEISDKITHEEGMLGACLHRDPRSAACRFYLTAAKMPFMDGSFTLFGKITKGLDIVHTINTRAGNEMDRPNQPVVIRSVTIQTAVE